MRLEGRVTRWNDEKGFGFISRQGEKAPVFVHIKAFPRESGRPVRGDVVSYEMARDKNGRLRAENARYSEQRSSNKRATRRDKTGGLAVVFTWLFVSLLFAGAYFERIPWLLLAACLFVSLVTFLAYGWDKSSARLGKWRTAESSLHFMALVGGWPGALAAQRLLRHKSSKQAFLSVFWVTVFLNVAAVGYVGWSGDSGFVSQFIDRVWQSTGW